MRLSAPLPGLCIGLAACTLPNPAYHITQGFLESSSSDSPSSTGADSTGGATTLDPPTTGVTHGAGSTGATATTEGVGETLDTTAATTLDPQTATSLTSDGTTGGTATSTGDGTDSTSTGSGDSNSSMPVLDLGGVDMCALVDAPELKVKVQHSPPPGTCTSPFTAFYGVLESKPGPSTLKFRRCLNTNECYAGNIACPLAETVVLHVEGPPTHVPQVPVGACMQLAYAGTGYADGSTCNTRVMRLAKTGANILNTAVFVAGTAAPDSSQLPQGWPDNLGFTVKASLVAPCSDQQVCGAPTGTHDLVATFSGAQHVVPMGHEEPAKLPLLDKNAVKIGDVPGTFFNLRSYAHPLETCEFSWIWLADDYKP